jgi:hypothetical protein
MNDIEEMHGRVRNMKHPFEIVIIASQCVQLTMEFSRDMQAPRRNWLGDSPVDGSVIIEGNPEKDNWVKHIYGGVDHGKEKDWQAFTIWDGNTARVDSIATRCARILQETMQMCDDAYNKIQKKNYYFRSIKVTEDKSLKIDWSKNRKRRYNLRVRFDQHGLDFKIWLGKLELSYDILPF